MAYIPTPVSFLTTQTLIVPMDSDYQNGGMYKAFGLIFRLLYENVIRTDPDNLNYNPNYEPIYVYWAINPDKKTLLDTDFTATTKGYNTTLTPLSDLRSYKGGPFIIKTQSATSLNDVKAIINAWNTANTTAKNKVYIHELVNNITINTIAKLVRPPRISVEQNNAGIPIAYLNAAGLPDYYNLSGNPYTTVTPWTDKNISVLSSDVINGGGFFGSTHGTACQKLAYDIFISPHTKEDSWTNVTLTQLDEFVRLGGVVHNMCASISALENKTHFLTNKGITTNNGGTSFGITTGQFTNPLVQVVPTADPQARPGGSEETWLHSTDYKSLTKVLAYFTGTTQYDFMIAGQYQGSLINPDPSGAGAIVYEGGHSYEEVVPYTDNQEDMYTKFVLNSVFLSVTKPLIDLTMSPNPIKVGVANDLTFTVRNIGGAKAENATISVTLLPNMDPSGYGTAIRTDDISTGYTLTWNNQNLDGGEAITFSVNSYIPTDSGSYPIKFSATYGDEIFATSQNPYKINSCSTLTVKPSDSPYLSIEKKVDGNYQTFIESGGNVVFTYTITNDGDQTAYNIELVDENLFNYFKNFNITTLPAFPTSPTIDYVNKKVVFPTGVSPSGLTIAAGASLIVTINAAHKGDSVVPPDQIINTAYVTYHKLNVTTDLISNNSSAKIFIVMPDIKVDKSRDLADAAINDFIKYKIVITNPGNTTITEVHLTDAIPNGTIFVPDSLKVTTANISPTPTITATYISSPAPGNIDVIVEGNLEALQATPGTLTDSITVEFDVQVKTIPQNPIPNYATVVYTYEKGEQATGTATKDSKPDVLTNIASLQILKDAPSTVELGKELTYEISLTNNGKVDLNNVQLVDTIPAGTSYVGSTGATLISQVGQDVILQVSSITINSVANVTITVAVNTLPPPPSYTITNNVSAIIILNGDEKEPITASKTTDVVKSIINVNKGTLGNIANAKVGDTVTYSIVVTNTGNVPVTLTKLTDVIAQDTDTIYKKNFTVGGVLLDPQPTSLSDVDLTAAAPENILDPLDHVTITYDMLVNSVPAGVNPKIDDTVTISFDYPIGQGTGHDQQQNSYTVNIQTPDISVVKTVDVENAAVADVLTYTVEITNPGTVNLDSITLTDFIPTGTNYKANSINVSTNMVPPPTTISSQYIPLPKPELEVNIIGTIKPLTDKITVTFQVEVVEPITQNPIENVVTVGYTYRIDPMEKPRTGTPEDSSIQTNIASLGVKKIAPSVIELGKTITYQITLDNNGTVDLENVKLIDTIPEGTSYVSVTGAIYEGVSNQDVTFLVSSILAGEKKYIDITVKVDTLPAKPYNIINKVSAIYTVNGDEKPPVMDTAVTSVVKGSIDVKKVTVGDITYAKVGDTVTYSVTVTNTGNVDVNLTNLLDDILPKTYTNPTSTNKSLSITLQPGKSTTITYDVVLTALPPDKKLVNTATVSFNYKVGQDTIYDSAKKTFTLNVEEVKVSISKSLDKTFAEPGEKLTYTFTINNESSVPITNVYLYDPLPANTSFEEGSFSLNSGENPTVSPGALIGDIPKNSSVVVSFKVKVNSNLTSAVNIKNSGSVTYNYKLDPSEPGPGKTAGPVNSNDVNTQVQIPKIEIIKSIPVNQQYAEVGDIIKYTITIKNTGTVDAHDVKITDILPSELRFVPGTLVATMQPIVQVGDTVTGSTPDQVVFSIIRANPNTATIQFDAEVLKRPSSGKIDNIAYGNFKYSLDPQKTPTLSKVDIPSNKVTTTVEEIKVEMLKTSNGNYVEVGQDLTYTVQVTNKSTVPVDIKFTDTLPSVTEYVTGSFELISGTAAVVNNTAPEGTLIDVDITGMQPQSSVIFSYKVKVLSLPQGTLPQKITNAAVAEPSYSLYPGGPIRQGDPVKDEVTTEVKLIKIEAVKEVEESIATIGDILHYTVRIINNGNTTAENVKLSDNVPDGTEFVEGSLTVDGAEVDASPEDGIDIGSMIPGQIVTIKFNVKVIAIPNPPNESKAENTALVTFEVELDGVLQPRDPVNSNPVETELKKIKLEVTKTVDKDMAEVGDTLSYTVVIKNTGDVTINNVIFNDQIPEGTILIGTQPVQNINLGSIKPGESKTVAFKVKISFKPCPPKLINKATINGSYVVETQRKLTEESNEVITYVGVIIFKQISVDENLTIPEVKPDAEDILEVIADVEITYTNVIKTPIVTSYEGQHLTGWKLIVEGKLKQKIVYIADEPTQSVHAAEFDVPFSTFLVLPKDFKPCQKIKVEGIIEDVFVKLIDKRTIFKNVTLMLQGKGIC